MIDYEFSDHVAEMLKERNIRVAWVELTLEQPGKKKTREDGTVHYIKAIKEHGGRHLRVVVNPRLTPPKIVTLLFDRKLGRLP